MGLPGVGHPHKGVSEEGEVPPPGVPTPFQVELFVGCLQGARQEETRWSREEYYRKEDPGPNSAKHHRSCRLNKYWDTKKIKVQIKTKIQHLLFNVTLT